MHWRFFVDSWLFIDLYTKYLYFVLVICELLYKKSFAVTRSLLEVTIIKMPRSQYLNCNVCGESVQNLSNFTYKTCKSCHNFFCRSNLQMMRWEYLQQYFRTRLLQLVVCCKSLFCLTNHQMHKISRCPTFRYPCNCVEKCSGNPTTFCNFTKQTRNSCKQCRYKKCAFCFSN